jgi:hypothetical protein
VHKQPVSLLITITKAVAAEGLTAQLAAIHQSAASLGHDLSGYALQRDANRTLLLLLPLVWLTVLLDRKCPIGVFVLMLSGTWTAWACSAGFVFMNGKLGIH